MDEWKTNCRGSSQIPAFGNWDYVNDLPITQYFECARQAGLIRYSSSSGECDPHSAAAAATADSYAVAPRSKQMQGKGREKRGGMAQAGNYNYSHNNKQEGNMNSKKQGAGKVFNVTVTELPASKAAAGGKRHHAVKKQQQQQQQQFQHNAGSAAPQAQAQAQAQARRPPKAVDEDLYKIPPELLKRKRRLGFISRCLVPPCAV